MRTLFCLMLILLYLCANDFEKTLQEQSGQDLEKEYDNGLGTTVLKSDPSSNHLSVDNSTPLYENGFNSVLFQEQSTLNNNNQDYQGALVYHYKKDDFSLGLHSFFNAKNLNPKLKSEFKYKNYFKAYTQYTQNDAKNLEQSFGIMVFNFDFDFNKDEQEQDYQFSYRPYGNAFSIKLNHKDFNENTSSDSILFGFNFNFNEDFSKQLLKKDFESVFDLMH